jgi:hypothetical protein
MSRTYDALMDRMADLTVAAVQDPAAAAQAYWLSIVCAAASTPSSAVPCSSLVARARADGGLPAWARPLLPPALVELLRARTLLLIEPAVVLPAAGVCAWKDLAAFCAAAVLRLPASDPVSLADMGAAGRRLWQAACRLYGPHPPSWAACPEETVRGAVLFDAGLYFACHEYFETLWGRTGDDASDLFQGLIQVAVAMRHLESHNRRGAERLLQTGMQRLRRYPTGYQGLDLEGFLAQLSGMLALLRTAPEQVFSPYDAGRAPRLLGHV